MRKSRLITALCNVDSWLLGYFRVDVGWLVVLGLTAL